MKILFVLAVAISISNTCLSQKDKTKPVVSETTKEKIRRVILGEETTNKGSNDKAGENLPGSKHDKAVLDGTKGGGSKPSKNQPAKVRQAFATDYPGATNVSWNKYRGDWIATFSNNGITSTAVYHANGQRKDAGRR